MGNKKHKTKSNLSQKLAIGLLAVLTVFVLALSDRSPATANSLDDQINALRKKVSSNQEVINDLKSRSDTLANRLALLRAQIAETQASIDLAEARKRRITASIEEASRELEQKKTILAANIRLIYQESSITPLEMLFSSQSLSEFIDRQQYLERVKDNVQTAAKRVAELKQQLEDEERQLQAQIARQESLRYGLDKQTGEVGQLLAETQGQEVAYRARVVADQQRLRELMAIQAAAFASQASGTIYGGTGGYPWANAQPFPNWNADPWGFYLRQCTSYAAWRRANLGLPIPVYGNQGYQANAGDWPAIASASGFTVNNTPAVGSVMIIPYGPGFPFGHAAIVEAVTNGGATVWVSQFNGEMKGLYSQASFSINGKLFIH